MLIDCADARAALARGAARGGRRRRARGVRRPPRHRRGAALPRGARRCRGAARAWRERAWRDGAGVDAGRGPAALRPRQGGADHARARSRPRARRRDMSAPHGRSRGRRRGGASRGEGAHEREPAAAGALDRRPHPPADDAVLARRRGRARDRGLSFPWTRGNFVDSLAAGYIAWTLNGSGGELLAYCVAMRGAGEMHLLNITVAPAARRRGHARRLLDALVRRVPRRRRRAPLARGADSNVDARGPICGSASPRSACARATTRRRPARARTRWS